METHPAYAVVLDEEGRFLKAANLRYQVGDTVQEIVELQTAPEEGYPPMEAPVRPGGPGRLPLPGVLWVLPAKFHRLRHPAHPDQPGCGDDRQPH